MTAQAARGSPSNGMPTLPGFTSRTPPGPVRSNGRCVWPKTISRSPCPPSSSSSSSPDAGLACIGEDGFERFEIAVYVVDQPEHRAATLNELGLSRLVLRLLLLRLLGGRVVTVDAGPLDRLGDLVGRFVAALLGLVDLAVHLHRLTDRRDRALDAGEQDAHVAGRVRRDRALGVVADLGRADDERRAVVGDDGAADIDAHARGVLALLVEVLGLVVLAVLVARLTV